MNQRSTYLEKHTCIPISRYKVLRDTNSMADHFRESIAEPIVARECTGRPPSVNVVSEPGVMSSVWGNRATRVYHLQKIGFGWFPSVHRTAIPREDSTTTFQNERNYVPNQSKLLWTPSLRFISLSFVSFVLSICRGRPRKKCYFLKVK